MNSVKKKPHNTASISQTTKEKKKNHCFNTKQTAGRTKQRLKCTVPEKQTKKKKQERDIEDGSGGGGSCSSIFVGVAFQSHLLFAFLDDEKRQDKNKQKSKCIESASRTRTQQLARNEL